MVLNFRRKTVIRCLTVLMLVGTLCGCPEYAADSRYVTYEVIEETVVRDIEALKGDVTDYVLRGYRRGRETTVKIVESAFREGKDWNINPLMILAVAAVESGFNPRARSKANARGVMQVHMPAHGKKFTEDGCRVSAYDIDLNIKIGTEIFKKYIVEAGGVKEALKWYVGARFLRTDDGYGSRVFVEFSRLELAAKGEVREALELLKAHRPSESYKTYERSAPFAYKTMLDSVTTTSKRVVEHIVEPKEKTVEENPVN